MIMIRVMSLLSYVNCYFLYVGQQIYNIHETSLAGRHIFCLFSQVHIIYDLVMFIKHELLPWDYHYQCCSMYILITPYDTYHSVLEDSLVEAGIWKKANPWFSALVRSAALLPKTKHVFNRSDSFKGLSSVHWYIYIYMKPTRSKENKLA